MTLTQRKTVTSSASAASQPPPTSSSSPAAPTITPPTKQNSITLHLTQAALIVAFFAVALGLTSYILTTDSVTFRLHDQYFPPPPVTFTLSELAQYDGTVKGKPIYISLKGQVYDVTSGHKYYGPGGAYHVFAGRDATRVMVTGCFKAPSKWTHDLRGLDDNKLKQIDEWIRFFNTHKRYRKVGTVTLPAIDDAAPLPNDNCTDVTEPEQVTTAVNPTT